MSYQLYEAIDLASLFLENVAISARCSFSKCNARIIPITPKLHDGLHKVRDSPQMMIPSSNNLDAQMLQAEQEQSYFMIHDVWDFDNIGVSKSSSELARDHASDGEETLDIQRLLICSECDRGPIGFACIPKSKSSDVRNLVYYLNCASLVYDIQSIQSAGN